jgi:hypothetical protein
MNDLRVCIAPFLSIGFVRSLATKPGKNLGKTWEKHGMVEVIIVNVFSFFDTSHVSYSQKTWEKHGMDELERLFR